MKIQIPNFSLPPSICPQKSVESYIRDVENLWVPHAFFINKYVK